MTVTLKEPEDLPRLRELVHKELNAKQRDRYRAVLLATENLKGDEIAQRLGRSPRFVDQWLARYRRQGLEGLKPKKQPGRAPKLSAEQQTLLQARLDAAPQDEDGVCSLRGKDICRLLEKEFGVVHSLGAIYGVLRRLGYSSLKPRPRHPKNDPAALQQFIRDTPFLSSR